MFTCLFTSERRRKCDHITTNKKNKNLRYLITGAEGFIGSWIIKCLLDDHVTDPKNIIATDAKLDDHIASQVLIGDEMEKKRLQSIVRKTLDVCDIKQCEDILATYNPHVVIHLAALQIPTCRSNPILGAQVNVLGTLNLFECVRKYNEKHKSDNKQKIFGIVYASSAGVCGPKADYKDGCAKDDDVHRPLTHYGYFKLCNEGNAKVYYLDHGISSIGLRPLTVYGVGREVGLYMYATVLQNVPFQIRYRGTTLFHYVKDIAKLFVECAHLLEHKHGAFTCNISGNTMSVEDFLQLLFEKLPESKKWISIHKNANELPLPDRMEQHNLLQLFDQDSSKIPKVTSISEGMDEMISMYKKLKSLNLLDAKDLEQ
ncbi:hypothetical protein RFI_11726 [Reticulomyxa filosa]|uniref:NAD-dependent epimerase/dehydratase domain-containing protein n=1 Tax=Reticulomyxa filosa TaxID=46433 RepID=X6NGI8_RETFI|nr:hypothetical protein RFI_11726 [Reticulomyxa filosa]|eukprot:ETO25415.1 hypothetical protein RFI_11726 [Reticulomyxa filosa]